MMKLWAFAASEAATISEALALVNAAMLRAMVVANSVGSWLTSPTRARYQVSDSERRSRPSRSTYATRTSCGPA